MKIYVSKYDYVTLWGIGPEEWISAGTVFKVTGICGEGVILTPVDKVETVSAITVSPELLNFGFDEAIKREDDYTGIVVNTLNSTTRHL